MRTHKLNKSLIEFDPSSNPLSVLGNGVVANPSLTVVEDCAVLVVSAEVVFVFVLALLSIPVRDALGLEDTATAEFAGWPEGLIPCGTFGASLCLSICTSASSSDILLTELNLELNLLDFKVCLMTENNQAQLIAQRVLGQSDRERTRKRQTPRVRSLRLTCAYEDVQAALKGQILCRYDPVSDTLSKGRTGPG